MLFFKPKPKIDEEFLPPPPPPEFDEFNQKPELFDETMQPKRAEQIPEGGEFDNMMKGLEKNSRQKSGVKKKAMPKKKQQTPKKIAQKQLKKAVNRAKVKKPMQKKLPGKITKKSKKPLSVKRLDYKKAQQLKPKKPAQAAPKNTEFAPAKEISEDGALMPEELEIPEIDSGKQVQSAKPKEIQEAEEEIKSAIENIKYHEEKPSLFKRFLTGKKAEPENIPAPRNKDDVSAIKDSIAAARESLMKFDLEAAKRSYIEVMRIYNKIGSEEQAKVYNDIKDLYFERKSAEELKV